MHFFKDNLQLFDFQSTNPSALTLSKTSPGFYMSAVQVFWKHWEKEKSLVMSNFSFSYIVFYPYEELSAISVKFEIVVCKLFQFGGVQNLSFGKGLIRTNTVVPFLELAIYQMIKLDELCNSKTEICLWKGG